MNTPLPRLRAMRLKSDHPWNTATYLESYNLAFGRFYAVLGEWGTSGHHIAMDVSSGKIVPGIVHLDRFEDLPEDEL